jgi:hypothetical protein
MELRLLVKMIAPADDVKTTFFVCAFAQEANNGLNIPGHMGILCCTEKNSQGF